MTAQQKAGDYFMTFGAGSSQENRSLLSPGNWPASKLKMGIAPAETNFSQKSHPSSPGDCRSQLAEDGFPTHFRVHVSKYTYPTANGEQDRQCDTTAFHDACLFETCIDHADYC